MKKILDLSIWQDIKIAIYNPVIIDENNLFKYNLSSEYYNNLCYPYKTKYKTDIILKDRRKEYINNNLSLCENNCQYKGYDVITKKQNVNAILKRISIIF